MIQEMSKYTERCPHTGHYHKERPSYH